MLSFSSSVVTSPAAAWVAGGELSSASEASSAARDRSWGSSVILKQLFEETIENQRVARIAAEQLFFQTYTRYLDMYRLTPEERYDKLLERYPEVLQFISLKEIASYLNITPVHMSRIRSKIFK